MHYFSRNNSFFSIICIMVLIPFYLLRAQTDSLPSNVFAPSMNIYGGALIKAYPDVPHSNHAVLLGIAITWQTQGKDNWHQLYRFPKTGAEIILADFGNPVSLGQAIGFIPTLELKGNKGKRWRFKAGFGAA
jgi:hypothetical protein